MYTRRLCLALATTLMALTVSAAEANAVDGPYFGIHVANGDNPNFLTFRSARCSVNKRRFFAVARDQGWALHVVVQPFTGFHPYALKRGVFTGTFLSLQSPDWPRTGNMYASDFVPPHHEPGAGQIDFRDHDKLVGGGFAAMFNEDGSDAVDVGGVLRCHYPQKSRR